MSASNSAIPGVTEDRVTISIEDGIADVRMNRADKRNALDNAMFTSLAAAGEYLKTLPDLRAVVLSGDGASFCAGLDFGSFQAMAQGSSGQGGSVNAGSMSDGRITHLAQQVCWVWQEVPVPVIAAVHGHALGGGMQIALGADIRIVHPDTQLSVREVHWGLIPDMTGTLMLSRLVRPDIVKDLVFSARVFQGPKVSNLAWSLVVEDPAGRRNGPCSGNRWPQPGCGSGAKKLINLMTNEGAAQQFAAEREVIGKLIGGANQVEAVMSHFEKRPPKFSSSSIFG